MNPHRVGEIETTLHLIIQFFQHRNRHQRLPQRPVKDVLHKETPILKCQDLISI